MSVFTLNPKISGYSLTARSALFPRLQPRLNLFRPRRPEPRPCPPPPYTHAQISSRSRLSSLCWSSYVKSHLACSDYEGLVQLWDAHSSTELAGFEEHAKRVWSVDFSRLDPTRLASGSDDMTVKVRGGGGEKGGGLF